MINLFVGVVISRCEVNDERFATISSGLDGRVEGDLVSKVQITLRFKLLGAHSLESLRYIQYRIIDYQDLFFCQITKFNESKALSFAILNILIFMCLKPIVKIDLFSFKISSIDVHSI